MADDYRMSPAVLRGRTEPLDSVDDFPTPPWATRALCEWLKARGHELERQAVREPAANRGFMAHALGEYFGEVKASDLCDYGAGFPIADYLAEDLELELVDWTISNPPFNVAREFIERALSSSRVGVAMLVRTAYLESQRRSAFFAEISPPAFVLIFSERVVMLRGRLVRAGDPDPSNIDPSTGKPRKASTATSYAWIVWIRGERDSRVRWLEPCRKALEKPGDYPAAAALVGKSLSYNPARLTPFSGAIRLAQIAIKKFVIRFSSRDKAEGARAFSPIIVPRSLGGLRACRLAFSGLLTRCSAALVFSRTKAASREAPLSDTTKPESHSLADRGAFLVRAFHALALQNANRGQI